MGSSVFLARAIVRAQLPEARFVAGERRDKVEAPLTSFARIAHSLRARSAAIQWSAQRHLLIQPVRKDRFKANDINPAAHPDGPRSAEREGEKEVDR